MSRLYANKMLGTHEHSFLLRPAGGVHHDIGTVPRQFTCPRLRKYQIWKVATSSDDADPGRATQKFSPKPIHPRGQHLFARHHASVCSGIQGHVAVRMCFQQHDAGVAMKLLPFDYMLIGSATAKCSIVSLTWSDMQCVHSHQGA